MIRSASFSVLICLLVGCGAPESTPAPAPAQVAGKPVRVQAVAERAFREQVEVVGSLRSRHRALVSARTAGPIEALLVAEGARVQAGETVLARIDASTRQQALAISEREVAVAAAALRARRAEVERLQADQRLAQLDRDRYARLAAEQAVGRSVLEQQESRLAQVEAAQLAAAAAVDLASEQLAQARLAVEISRTQLDDCLVRAPIDGVVSEILLEAGEMAAPGLPILRLEDPQRLEVRAYLPEQLSGRLVPGQTQLELHDGAEPLATVLLDHLAPTIDRQLRTIEIRARLDDPPAALRPGGTARLRVLLAERRGLALPLDAVVQRRDQQLVFVVAQGRARAVPVQTGLRSEGWIEILAGLAGGEQVVVAGQDMLEDGAALRLLDGAQP